MLEFNRSNVGYSISVPPPAYPLFCRVLNAALFDPLTISWKDIP